MSEDKTKWTLQQEQAIKTIDRNLLVSAAAGSGKTSVLAERCAYLVCEAPAPFRCNIDELLVVTFTVAAANEMRSRIAGALKKRFDEANDPHIAKQLALIDRASIGTIHSFCSEAIRRHFHLLAIDPNVQLIAEEEGSLLRIETARDLFAERYECDESGAFQRFIDHYGDGNDQTPRARVVHASAMLDSLIDPEKWIAEARRRVVEVGTLPQSADGPRAEAKGFKPGFVPFAQTAFGHQLFDRIKTLLRSTIERCNRLIPKLSADPQLPKYHVYSETLLAHLRDCEIAFEQSNLDALVEVVKRVDFGKLPTVTKRTAAQEALKVELAALRDSIKSGELATLCRFSETEWRDGMSRIIEPTNVFLDLVVDFRKRYTLAKSELRSLDFADLERLALRVLADRSLQPTEAALAYRRRFKHVLVDEYQDVNELQDTILSLISRPSDSADSRGNFFCVGDVKQSIYRFRLAEPQRFLDRYKTYTAFNEAQTDCLSPGERIDLQTNFRSRGGLLDTLNGLFGRLMGRATAEVDYDERQRLIAPSDSPYDPAAAAAPLTELHLLSLPSASHSHSDADDSDAPSDDAAELDRTEREAHFIAKRIGELVGHTDKPAMQVFDRSTGGTRPIRFGDIAILMRSMRFKADQFTAVLRGAGINVHASSGSGFFETMEVRDLLALLKVLDNRRQDIPLAALLRSPIAAIDKAEDALATIRIAYPSRGEGAVEFHEAAIRYAVDFEDELAVQLRDFFQQLDGWRDLTQRRPLADVLWTIFEETGYLAFVEGLDDGEQRVANLILLHERARQFGTFRRQGLGRFMRFLDSLRDETDLSSASIAADADDVVRIMSVHASKGLEFPVVFLPDLGKRHNLRDASGSILFDREAGLGLQVCDDVNRVRYPSLATTIVSERLRRQMLAEEMRILYVAATRAREKLILLGTCKDSQHESWRQEWSGHVGALPTESVLCGGCMLDWLGPAMTAMASEVGLSFDIFPHACDENFAVEQITNRRGRTLTTFQKSLARLAPIEPAPPADREADAVWARLTQRYRFDTFTREPATQAMTALKGAAADVETRGVASADALAPISLLRRPRAAAAMFEPTAADIGTATHLLLEHLDYRTVIDLKTLEAHRDDLVNRRLIDRNVAPRIDLPSVEWMLESSIGKLLRQHADVLLREVPINMPQDIRTDESLPLVDRDMDRTVLRGRVDAVIPLDEGAIVIDFKTDRVDGEWLQRRATLYRSQLRTYVEALSLLTGKPVSRSALVFLSARTIVD